MFAGRHLDDSAITIVTKDANVIEAEEYHVSGAGSWIYDACCVRCRDCRAFLGIKLRSMRASLLLEFDRDRLASWPNAAAVSVGLFEEAESEAVDEGGDTSGGGGGGVHVNPVDEDEDTSGGARGQERVSEDGRSLPGSETSRYAPPLKLMVMHACMGLRP